MNAKQIEMFRNLYAPPASSDHDSDDQRAGHLITPNIRQLQPLNNRTILASFLTHGRLDMGNGNVNGEPIVSFSNSGNHLGSASVGGGHLVGHHSALDPYSGAASSALHGGIANRWSWLLACMASFLIVSWSLSITGVQDNNHSKSKR